jgi:hypothetical protein
VELYDRADPEKMSLSIQEALSIVEDSRYWTFQTAPNAICLFLTELGLRHLRGDSVE